MGMCGSTEAQSPEEIARAKHEKELDKAVSGTLKQSEAADRTIHKLLLLGAGASGKSTLFKQMITIYGKGFPDSERKTYTNIVYNNVLTAMRTLVRMAPRYGQISPKNEQARATLEVEYKEDHVIDPPLGHFIKQLWADPAIQLAYDHQNEFQLTDSAKYFFERIDEISRIGYIPTEADVLRSRAPTTGIVENVFEIDGNTFKMFDVGGQRNERKKWIHCFENVTAVMFVAAMSEYNQVLYEDSSVNRLTESLNLFDEICNSQWFRNTSIILFLNKRDIFGEKVGRFPLSNWFPDYKGQNEYEEASEWIRHQFEERNQDTHKTIYTHMTCATDTNNVHAVFSAVKDIIIRKNLNKVGLI